VSLCIGRMLSREDNGRPRRGVELLPERTEAGANHESVLDWLVKWAPASLREG
jgi:hypothetical protein